MKPDTKKTSVKKGKDAARACADNAPKKKKSVKKKSGGTSGIDGFGFGYDEESDSRGKSTKKKGSVKNSSNETGSKKKKSAVKKSTKSNTEKKKNSTKKSSTKGSTKKKQGSTKKSSTKSSTKKKDASVKKSTTKGKSTKKKGSVKNSTNETGSKKKKSAAKKSSTKTKAEKKKNSTKKSSTKGSTKKKQGSAKKSLTAATVAKQPSATQGARLSVPEGFIGEIPPIFIDNSAQHSMDKTTAFGRQMVTQHTLKKKTTGCCCCKNNFHIPGEYSVAKGPASDESEVLVTGQYAWKEKCGFFGLCRMLPSSVQPSCYADMSTFEFNVPRESEKLSISRGQ